MADAFDHCERAAARRRQGPVPRDACSRRRNTAARCLRCTPSISKWRARGSWRASRCRAKSGCNGGARCLSGIGRGDIDAHPVAAAIRDVVVRYRLPPKALADLIDARTFDLYDEPMADVAVPRALRHAHIVGADRACRAHPARRPRSGHRPARGPCRDGLCDIGAAPGAAGACRAGADLSARRPDAALRRADGGYSRGPGHRPKFARCWPNCGCGRGTISARCSRCSLRLRPKCCRRCCRSRW